MKFADRIALFSKRNQRTCLCSMHNGLEAFGTARRLKLDGFRGSQRVVSEWATDAVAPKRPAISNCRRCPRLERSQG
jgi:hypothetical protein